MDRMTVLPECAITSNGPVSDRFIELGIKTFSAACRYVHEIPYGYNSDRDDPMVLFKENKGSCTTKHAVIATLSAELGTGVKKNIGIYAMTEKLVTGTDPILNHFSLPYLPMVHCFLAFGDCRVDLTEGNRNGKNGPIDEFLLTREVEPNISARKEYILYRKGLEQEVLIRQELLGITLKQVLQAREQGLKVLKDNIL